jgi:2-keto-4-pentenoate hydratase/2-oxohepta-3-ene-1,7-dioic acid hydratase in catechol pathway
MVHGKHGDTCKPFGRWMVPRLEPRRFRISVRHHGPVWEDGSSADQLWDTATWMQELSRETPLHPGDVLWMGPQGANGHLVPGDVIALEISDIGLLRHDVVAEE